VNLLDLIQNDDEDRLLIERVWIWKIHVFIRMKISYLLFF